ncbi:MAG: hypothetical protein HY719_15045 [Planctomycetes bacterium]|nr:hypothetical protein [Planctomycetota bacterium]
MARKASSIQPTITPTPLTYLVTIFFRPRETSTDPAAAVEMIYPSDLRERLLLIFGDPIRTTVSLEGGGAVWNAVKQGISGAGNKVAMFRPGQVSAQAPTPEETAAAIKSLYAAFAGANPHLKASLCVSRYEFEFMLHNVLSSGDWLADRFVRHAIALQDGWHVPRAKVAFSVNRGEGVEYSIRIEPRAGKEAYFFVEAQSGLEPLGIIDPVNDSHWCRYLQEGLDRARELVLAWFQAPRRSDKTTSKQK